MTKKENLKETVLILSLDEKQFKKDLEEILKITKEKKSKPFYSVYILLPLGLKEEYIINLAKNLDIKRQSFDKNFLMLEI